MKSDAERLALCQSREVIYLESIAKLADKCVELQAAIRGLKLSLTAFRDHVSRNAVTWAPGMGSHHHPIWSKVTAALDTADGTQTESDQAADLYYLQDSRQYVGNSMLWWRAGGAGYTTNIEEAGVFTKDQAFSQHRCREGDRPWSKRYVDTLANRHIDHQKLTREHDAADGKGNIVALCSDCPPIGYPTNKTRCNGCPRGDGKEAL